MIMTPNTVALSSRKLCLSVSRQSAPTREKSGLCEAQSTATRRSKHFRPIIEPMVWIMYFDTDHSRRARATWMDFLEMDRF
jgi:hypothetical protein